MEFNEERIEKARDENEVWKIVNDITKPRSEPRWRPEEDRKIIEEEGEIANIFNNYSKEKIEKLKENID